MKFSIVCAIFIISCATAVPYQSFEKLTVAPTLQCNNGIKVYDGKTVIWQKDVSKVTCQPKEDVCGLISIDYTWTESGNTMEYRQAIGACTSSEAVDGLCKEAESKMPAQGKILQCNAKSCDTDFCFDLVPQGLGPIPPPKPGSIKCNTGIKVYDGNGKVVYEKDVSKMTCNENQNVCGLLSMDYTWTESGTTTELTQAIGFCAYSSSVTSSCKEAEAQMPPQGKVLKCNAKSCDTDFCFDLVPQL